MAIDLAQVVGESRQLRVRYATDNAPDSSSNVRRLKSEDGNSGVCSLLYILLHDLVCRG